jgi:hypothetical protein
MGKYRYFILNLVFIAAILINISCDKEDQAGTVLLGTVKNMLDDETVHPAFLILGNELLSTIDESGTYEITSLDPGIYSLVCSAINYADKTMQVELKEGHVVTYDFLLSPDSSEGRVYGELHDQTLYDEQLIVNPSLADWNAKELFDGVSGATLQTMTFGLDLPTSEIYIGDSLFSVTDGFGQYWFDVQPGTYPLRVSSIAYRDTMQIVKVEKDGRVYTNFILSK